MKNNFHHPTEMCKAKVRRLPFFNPKTHIDQILAQVMLQAPIGG